MPAVLRRVLDGAQQVAGVDRGAEFGGEDQARVGPPVPGPQPVLLLGGALLAQQIDYGGGDGAPFVGSAPSWAL